MKSDIARQPLIPAFLTLAALAVTAICCADPHGAQALSSASDGMAVSLPGDLLTAFQTTHPGWAGLAGGFLLLFAGMCIGRMTVRYNLYMVGTCLAIPLYAIIACGVASDSAFLSSFAAAALLALTSKNYARAFCNGYGFDSLFRGSLYLGLLPQIAPAALPLLLLLPLALLLFRRTVREAGVAVAGLLLPILTLCYINWGAGGSFTTPVVSIGTAFLSGSPLGLFPLLPLRSLILLGSIAALDLMALMLFLSDIYAVGTKPRFILIFNISMLALCAVLLCGPAATTGTIALLAVPSAVLLPVLFVRAHRTFSSLLYLLLLAAAFLGVVLQ